MPNVVYGDICVKMSRKVFHFVDFKLYKEAYGAELHKMECLFCISVHLLNLSKPENYSSLVVLGSF